MAPVTFFKGSKNPVEPFYINPWAEEDSDMSGQPGCLVSLRGDFLCLPFGGDNNWKDEHHPTHGDVNEDNWMFEDDSVLGGETKAEFSFKMKTRPGRVVKTINLKDGENNIYINDRIEGFAGPACPGHHAIFPGVSNKLISMGPYKTGFTNKSPANGCGGDEYYALESFAEFDSLKKVPTKWKAEPFTDCSVFPSREGFIDILQVFVDDKADFAWTAAVVPEEGYLWFALKNPRVLPSTVMWMENRGRHGSPWNGRNCCVGIEDVCGYFADGLSSSSKENELTEKGFTTVHQLDGKIPFNVNYIHGIVRIPDEFDRVADVVKTSDGIRLISESGSSVETVVSIGFLKD
jgi:hypothetical protein